MYNSLFIPKEGIITAGRALLRKGKAAGEAEVSPNKHFQSISSLKSALALRHHAELEEERKEEKKGHYYFCNLTK